VRAEISLRGKDNTPAGLAAVELRKRAVMATGARSTLWQTGCSYKGAYAVRTPEEFFLPARGHCCRAAFPQSTASAITGCPGVGHWPETKLR